MTALWLTTRRHVAGFPTCFRVRCVAPDSFIPVPGRVSTVVAGVRYTSAGIHVIVNVFVRVRTLRVPGLTCFTAPCHRCVARVLKSSICCRVANYTHFQIRNRMHRWVAANSADSQTSQILSFGERVLSSDCLISYHFSNQGKTWHAWLHPLHLHVMISSAYFIFIGAPLRPCSVRNCKFNRI